jgi:TRAP-type C4-dicarboxylate transport system permease small subunit
MGGTFQASAGGVGQGGGVLGRIAGFLATVSKLSLWLAGIGLVVMTGFVAYQVFGRYVLNRSPSWTEPAAVMLMSWFIFLGAAAGVRLNFHLGFDVLLYALPKGKRMLRMISDVAVLAFGVGMAWYGTKLVMLTWNSTLPALGISGGFSYLPVTVGGFLISLFSLERIVLRLCGAAIDDDVLDAHRIEEKGT